VKEHWPPAGEIFPQVDVVGLEVSRQSDKEKDPQRIGSQAN